jgi:hypothetical protein
VPDARTLEIANEQSYVDRVYQRVEVLRRESRELAREGHGRAAAGPATGLVERDAIVHRAAGQLRTLDAEAEGLVFGRLDFDDGETYHIGRMGVRDDDREPLLIDWRAPAAAAFYRATSGEPMGVVRRRVIICRGPEVVDLDDDVLDPDHADDLRVLGEGALLAALRRSRGPHMRDIVTTIQREQDEAIRAPAHGVTPHHRRARAPERPRSRCTAPRTCSTPSGAASPTAGSLSSGPRRCSPTYIGRVLPALGEESVHLRAVGELVDGVTAHRRDPAPVAELKGSERMREVLTELMWHPRHPHPTGCVWCTRDRCSAVPAGELAPARERVRARADATGTRPNSARPLASTVLLEALWDKAEGAHLDRELFVDEVADRPEFGGSSPGGGRR